MKASRSLRFSPISHSLPSNMRRRQTHNLAPPLLPQLLRNRPTQPRPNRLARPIDEHPPIIVKPHIAAVLPPPLLARAHDDCVPDVAAPHLVGHGRRRRLVARV